jgi:hypothetical protein
MHWERRKKKEERKKEELRRKIKKKELRRIWSSSVGNKIKITIKKGLAVCTTSPTF